LIVVESYFVVDKLLEVVVRVGVEVVHFGYGFFVENVVFVCVVEGVGLMWIGLFFVAIELMGSKMCVC